MYQAKVKPSKEPSVENISSSEHGNSSRYSPPQPQRLVFQEKKIKSLVKEHHVLGSCLISQK